MTHEPPTPARDPELDQLATEAVLRAGVAPAAALGFAVHSGGEWLLAVGGAQHLAPFDLASVTKPFTALAAARLVAAGSVHWSDTLGALLPELAATPSAACSLEQLLAHRAGLLPHLELFAPLRARRAFTAAGALHVAASARHPACPWPCPAAGFAPFYSDLGYILAGCALERAVGLPLDGLVAREVLAPLGLAAGSLRQWLARGTKPRDVIPTETVAWRGGDLRAVVHDENAWALAGHGSAGHAGLFGTVEAVLGLGRSVLDALANRSAWLSRADAAFLIAERPGATLRLGFDGKTAEGPSAAGQLTGPRTFGHLGFTGTSFWCDPEAGIVTALLTNRVRPTRDNARIRAARPQIHDALYALARSAASPARAPLPAAGPT